MRHLISSVAAVLLMVGGPASVSASPIVITGHVDDYQVQHRYDSGTTITPATTGTSFVVGQYLKGTPGRGANPVFIFELPVLDPGHVMDTARFDLAVHSAYPDVTSTAGPFNVDLWGIGFQDSTAPINKYLDSDTSAAPHSVKLVDNWFKEGDIPFAQTLHTETDSLAIYIQTFYDANTDYAGGWYVFLRLNPDANPLNNDAFRTGVNFHSADASNDAHKPTLTLTTVIPEPASLVLLAIGAMAMAVWPSGRRRSDTWA